MLTELRADNYKSFSRPTAFPIRQITVLLGKNNSGKTAAARLALLILSALGLPQRPTASPLPLKVRGMTYGSSLLELTYGQLPHFPFTLGATLAPHRAKPINISFSLLQRQSLQQGHSSLVAGFSARPYINQVSWDQMAQTGDPQRPTYNDKFITGFRGVLPVFEDERRSSVDIVQSAASEQLVHTVHLSSIRAPIQAVYESRPPLDITEPTGAEVPYILFSDDELTYRVSRWYEEQLGLRDLGIESAGSAFGLTLRGDTDEGPNLARVGQGVQQVLPVVTYLLSMALGRIDTTFLAIEEPELHLHPAAHGALADLAIAAVNERESNQVLIETHSENLLLRLRRRVAEKKLDPAQLCLLYFEHTKQGSVVRSIDVSQDGSVNTWPRGVFAEDLKEIRGIVNASRP